MNDHAALENELRRLQERHEEQPEGRVFAPLADCLRKLGRLQEALGICHTGLNRHPRYSSAYVILGKIHLERGDAEAAREAFGRVLEFDPQNLLALRQLAELDEAAGDLGAAIERWEAVRAIEFDPAQAEARLEALRARSSEPDPDDSAMPDSPAIPSQPEEASVELDEVASTQTVDVIVPDPVDVVTPEPEHIATPELEQVATAEESVDPGTADPDAVEEPSPVVESTADEPSTAESPDEAIEDVPEAPVISEAPSVSETDAPPLPVETIARAEGAVPTTEIATMTLAEIYADQGFASKALDILRQVLTRHPDAESVAVRIAELETRLADEAAAPKHQQVGAPDDDLDEDDDVETLTLSAHTPEVEDDEVLPSPPIEARSSETVERDERERYDHFRRWLDRIRVDD